MPGKGRAQDFGLDSVVVFHGLRIQGLMLTAAILPRSLHWLCLLPVESGGSGKE